MAMSSNTDHSESTVSFLLDAVKLHFDSSQLKARLRKCHSSVIRAWKDENSFDLLHHCILENNIVATVLFLNEGYFKPPYEPSVWPYLHLIACMGHRGHISIVVQEIQFQSKAVYLDWDVFDKVINVKIKDNVCSVSKAERDKTLTPIDLAGIFKHSSCVELLLDYWHFNKVGLSFRRRNKNSSKSLYLSLTCEVNSPYALRLLLNNHDDKKEALESALRLMSPECIDVLLREKSLSDIKKAFHGMNLFHVLFSYSSCLSVKKYEAMAEVTSVLIRHGMDVNSCRPSRTYPLYSLLNHQISGVSVAEGSSYLIAILLLLLKSGADPNFDEILVEKTVFKSDERNAAFGRHPYSSSVMCVLSTLASWSQMCSGGMESELDVIEHHVYKCIEILLRHNLDLSLVGTFCDVLPDCDMTSQLNHTGNALHLLASTRPLHPISYPIMRLMLHYGINADVQGSWRAHSVHYYPLTFASNILLFSVWTHPKSDRHRRSSSHDLLVLNGKDLKLFTYILKFMSQISLQQAFLEFQEAADHLRSSVQNAEEKAQLELTHLSGNKIYKDVVEAYQKELSQPWPLQRCCSHAVWQACRFHMGNIFSLEIPTALKNIIMHFH